MVDRILVPLDGSGLAEAALAYAELLPSRRIRLIRVEADGSVGVAEARAYLDRTGERFRRQGREVEVAVASGEPAARIVEACEGADLVVMGTRGAGGAVGRLGSVADRVVRHAPAPVLVVRGGAAPVFGPPVARVVAPLDGSALAEAALPVVAAVAGDLGTPVLVLRVVDDDPVRDAALAGPPVAEGRRVAVEAERQQAEAYVADRVRRLRNRDLAASGACPVGPLGPTLLGTIRPTDLVVMATHGRSGPARLQLGSVAETLVREAAGPVLVVRAAAIDPAANEAAGTAAPAT
jgi:nucleotide-binding universal stress UspA family protein